MPATDRNELNGNRMKAEIARLMADTQKLNDEAGNMTLETFWSLVAVACGMIGAVATITVLLVKVVEHQ